jgi:hypothetical protein
MKVADVNQLHIQDNGVDSFHNCGGKIAFADILGIQIGDCGFGAKDFCIALAAEQDDSFVKDAQTGNFHWAGRTDEGVGGYTVKISDVNGEEASVKPYRFNIDVHIEQLGLACLYADRSIDNCLGAADRIETKVFDAVLV